MAGVMDSQANLYASSVDSLACELFLLAVANMVGEDTFYEDGASRDGRYAAHLALLTQLTGENCRKTWNSHR